MKEGKQGKREREREGGGRDQRTGMNRKDVNVLFINNITVVFSKLIFLGTLSLPPRIIKQIKSLCKMKDVFIKIKE